MSHVYTRNPAGARSGASHDGTRALVSTEWLAEHLDAPHVRPIEVDEDIRAYARAHIPGAIGWDWNRDLHHPLRRDYVDRRGLADLLEAAGVDDDTTVVLYGGNSNWFAAYAYWLLKLRGFDSVRLLDGGRKKWELEGRPLVEEVRRPERGRTLTRWGPERPELRAFRDEVLGALGASTFIDVRSPEEYRGEKLAPDHLPQEQPYVGGHIPGAVNIPWARAANEDGTFKSREELEATYGPAVRKGGETIAYCRIGERAAHTWFVLHELLGVERVKNYDGSWTEYGSMVNVPVER